MNACRLGGTAWAGPWGVRFASILTLDLDTGLGKWREADVVQAMRNGAHCAVGFAVGEPLIEILAQQTIRGSPEDPDADLRALWVYLRILPSICNRVPESRLPS